jgi:glycosyltransferase involved in cell wall biosynthesis
MASTKNDKQKTKNGAPMEHFQLFVEPTEYILDLIEAVHGPRGFTCAFAYDRKTLASQGTVAFPVMEKLSWGKRVCALWQALAHHDTVSIHSYSDPISITLLILNLFWRRKLLFEVDSAWREPRRWVPRILKRAWLTFWFTRPYVRGCAIGAQVHRDFFLNYGLPEKHLFERPNVVKNARYARPVPPIATEAFRFGYVGRLVRHKEVHTLIKAFRAIVRDYPQATLSIVGDGPERAALQAQAADLPQVTFHGAVYGQEKVALQHQMDALCLVSTYEPWGLVVNEALAGGTPCIVSACCGCVDPLIKGPRAGIVVPEGDVTALIAAMRQLIEHPQEAAAMGQRGATYLHTEWNYSRYLRALQS